MVTFSRGGSNATLSNPVLGDSRQLNIKTTFKQTMGGSYYSYKGSTTYKLLLTFTTITETAKDAFVAFYKANVGNQIIYTDYASVSWIGYFANDNLLVTTDRDGCSYSFTVEFIGMKG